jgi:hypothetical protein
MVRTNTYTFNLNRIIQHCIGYSILEDKEQDIINQVKKDKVISVHIIENWIKSTIKVDKFKSYYELTNSWLKKLLQGKKISNYFEINKIDKIAIYGAGELGIRLKDNLNLDGNQIKVEGFIDQNGKDEIPVITNLDLIPNVDCIVISPVFAYSKICKSLEGKSNARIVSLAEVIDGMN